MDEILIYFKNNPGFSRLLDGMLELYLRHNRCFGAARLMPPTPDEESAISEFFGRDYFNQALIRVSLADFEHQIEKTFGIAMPLGILLEDYFERPVTNTRNPQNIRNKDPFTLAIRDNILPEFTNTPAEAWLREMLARLRRNYNQLIPLYAAEPEQALAMVSSIANAINAVTARGRLRHLADFALEHTGDCASFDFYSPYGGVFLRALAYRLDAIVPATFSESVNLYLSAGLLAGGALSRVTVRGLRVNSDENFSHYEPYSLTLENICRFTKVETQSDKIFIIEDPLIFSAVSDNLYDFSCAIICAEGGLSPALERLLPLLGDVTLYYNGNMDFKGLIAADKVYMKYPNRFVPWRFSKEEYERLLLGAEGESLLPDARRDLALHNDELAALLSLMRKTGRTISSLPLIRDLANDIRKLNLKGF